VIEDVVDHEAVVMKIIDGADQVGKTAGIADQAAVEATVVVQAMMKDGEVEKTKRVQDQAVRPQKNKQERK